MTENTTIIFITFQILVFVLSLFGNALVVIAICKFIKNKSTTYKFIINLAISDMLTGLASLTQVIYISVQSLNENKYACLFRYEMVICLTLTSQLTVTFTTFDRYLAICHPVHYSRIMTKTLCNILLVTSWVYPFVTSVSPFFRLRNMELGAPCVFQKVTTRWQFLWNSLTLWIFTACTLVMYLIIMKKACRFYRQRRKISARITRIEEFTTADGFAAESNEAARKRKYEGNTSSLNGAKALAVITLLFTICWLPHTYFQFRGFLDSDYLNSKEWDIAAWIVFLGMANSVVNPFIYAWQRKDFNMAVKKMFCRRHRRVFVVERENNSAHVTRDAWF